MILRFQNETLKLEQGKYSKYLPYVFTEQGVAMLSSVLKTENAAKVSIAIMRAFVTMRHYLINNDIYLSLNKINNRLHNHENKLLEYDKNFKRIFNYFKSEDFKELVFLEGQVYNAYSKIIDIIKKAKNELIIIDNFADKTILDMISKIKIPTTLITRANNLLSNLDIEKYKAEYNNLKITYSDNFHDRFIILDRKQVYHLGASINKAGKRIFAINKFEDKEMINILLTKIKNL